MPELTHDRDREKDIEWEAAATPITLERVQLPKPFVTGITKVVISRKDDLSLTLIAEGKVANKDELAAARQLDEQQAIGSFVDPVELRFDAHGAACRLRAFVNNEPDELRVTGEGPPRFKQYASHIVFSQTWTKKFQFDEATDTSSLVPLGSEAWRSDWYINGPHRPFMRWTKRRRSATYHRERGDTGLTLSELPSGRSGRDHCLVATSDVRFTIGRVPEEFAPPWCHATAIEFPSPIPNKETRTAIAELVSFVTGRRLMPIGSTVFDSEGWPIHCEVRDPWGQQIRAQCEHSDVEPIPMPVLTHEMEMVLANLVPLYLEAREQFKLRDSLLTYWLANESYSGVDLALYGSAVEALKHAWFKSSKTRSKGVHMSQGEFERLAADSLPTLQQQLMDGGAPRAMIEKLSGVYRMGGNEQLNTFFAELGLTVGKVERDAIKERNRPVHGGLAAGTDQRRLVRAGNAYRCLFVRVFLKMIGYSGTYVDRTTLGHPSRPLDEPCGGKE